MIAKYHFDEGVTLKEVTGFDFETIRARKFKDIEKYLKAVRWGLKTMWAIRWRLTEDQLLGVVIQGMEKIKAHEEEEKEYEQTKEALRNQYLKAIEWLAIHGGVSEAQKQVLRRAWKAVKTGDLYTPNGYVFEVEGSTKGSVFNSEGLKQSLKNRGKSIQDFK